MAPPRSKSTKTNKSISQTKSLNANNQKQTFWLTIFCRKLLLLSRQIFFEQTYLSVIGYGLLVLELVLNILVVNYTKYTEIDWSTYMQQVECFLNGTLDYEQIGGDTGPLVYPAGHLWLFTGLYYITERGKNIYLAQHLFIALYLATLTVLLQLYTKHSKVPPYVLMLMCFSAHRIHSIYVLRLFNDPVAMFFLYTAVWCFTSKQWTLGSIFYSLAVSVKMNILLFAPALFLLYSETYSRIRDVFKQIAICAFVQIALAIPFLVSHPISYIGRSFNLGRVFLHKWTVNYRFLPVEWFVDRRFHFMLLALHLTTLLVFFWPRWLLLINKLFSKKNRLRTINLNGANIALTLFTANLIGITFARSLHYQFYVWYYHSLPFLLWNTSFKVSEKLCIWGLLELVWNIYPSTAWSSVLLHLCHLLLLIGLFFANFKQKSSPD